MPEHQQNNIMEEGQKETVKAFIEFINKKFGLKIPISAEGAPLMQKFLETMVMVYDEDGKPVFYCAQAIDPDIVFGMPPKIAGTLVLRVVDKDTIIDQLSAFCKK